MECIFLRRGKCRYPKPKNCYWFPRNMPALNLKSVVGRSDRRRFGSSEKIPSQGPDRRAPLTTCSIIKGWALNEANKRLVLKDRDGDMTESPTRSPSLNVIIIISNHSRIHSIYLSQLFLSDGRLDDNGVASLPFIAFNQSQIYPQISIQTVKHSVKLVNSSKLRQLEI